MGYCVRLLNPVAEDLKDIAKLADWVMSPEDKYDG
jgi:hypothetical protein